MSFTTDELIECGVCLTKLCDAPEDFVPCIIATCGHFVCLDCAEQIVQKKCPYCKEDVIMYVPIVQLVSHKKAAEEKIKRWKLAGAGSSEDGSRRRLIQRGPQQQFRSRRLGGEGYRLSTSGQHILGIADHLTAENEDEDEARVIRVEDSEFVGSVDQLEIFNDSRNMFREEEEDEDEDEYEYEDEDDEIPELVESRFQPQPMLVTSHDTPGVRVFGNISSPPTSNPILEAMLARQIQQNGTAHPELIQRLVEARHPNEFNNIIGNYYAEEEERHVQQLVSARLAELLPQYSAGNPQLTAKLNAARTLQELDDLIGLHNQYVVINKQQLILVHAENDETLRDEINACKNEDDFAKVKAKIDERTREALVLLNLKKEAMVQKYARDDRNLGHFIYGAKNMEELNVIAAELEGNDLQVYVNEIEEHFRIDKRALTEAFKSPPELAKKIQEARTIYDLDKLQTEYNLGISLGETELKEVKHQFILKHGTNKYFRQRFLRCRSKQECETVARRLTQDLVVLEAEYQSARRAVTSAARDEKLNSSQIRAVMDFLRDSNDEEMQVPNTLVGHTRVNGFIPL